MKNEHKYTFKMIKLDDILKTDDMNIRKVNDLSDLMASIKEHGIINPVTVMPIADGYQLLAGFRRCRAAMRLNMDKVPCHVYEDGNETTAKEIPITENISRMDMTPTEECLAVAHLVKKKNTPKTVARKFGKSLRWVLIRKKIADAGEKALTMLTDGKLELSAAAKLADLPDEDFKKVIEDNDYITKDTVDDILEKYHLDLDSAPFDHSKCLKCPKCSACQCDLFADEPKAYCLDPECYHKKVQEAAKKLVKDLVAEGKSARFGTFRSWGVDSDDEAYGYDLRSYHSDYKTAEEAGIAKRVLVNPDTCETFEYYDKRDLPGYVEESEEEIEARHEEENRERKLNGIRCNMYKDKLQAAIEKACSGNTELILTLMFLNTDDPEYYISEEFARKLGLWDEEQNYSRSFWRMDGEIKVTPKEIVDELKNNLDDLFGNLYYDTERMESVYKILCSKDPKKLSPSEKEVQKEFERQEKEENADE